MTEDSVDTPFLPSLCQTDIITITMQIVKNNGLTREF